VASVAQNNKRPEVDKQCIIKVIAEANVWLINRKDFDTHAIDKNGKTKYGRC
jgi:hypothetical protein